MSLLITCPACGLQGRTAADMSSTEVQCPRCGTPVPADGEASLGNANQPLDAFFAAACEQPISPLLPVPIPGMALPDASTSTDRSDAPAEEEWLNEERQRLQSYMTEHFGALSRQRAEFSTWRSQVEAALVGREQEVNRQQKILSHRAASLVEGESLAAAERERQAQQHQELEALSHASEESRATLATEQARVERLRAEAEQWQEAARRARDECLSLEEAVKNRRSFWESEETKQRGRQEGLDRRQGVLDRAEEELRLCVAETEVWEAEIRQDLDRQRRDLTRDSRELEGWRLEIALNSSRLERQRADLEVGEVASPFVNYSEPAA